MWCRFWFGIWMETGVHWGIQEGVGQFRALCHVALRSEIIRKISGNQKKCIEFMGKGVPGENKVKSHM